MTDAARKFNQESVLDQLAIDIFRDGGQQIAVDKFIDGDYNSLLQCQTRNSASKMVHSAESVSPSECGLENLDVVYHML